MKSVAEPHPSDRSFLAMVMAGAILLSGAALLMDSGGEVALLWWPYLVPVLGVLIAWHFVAWAVRWLVVGKAAGHRAGKLTEITLGGLLLAVMAAWVLLIAGGLIAMLAQAHFASRLWRAAWLLPLVFVAAKFFVGGFLNAQILVGHLRGRGFGEHQTGSDDQEQEHRHGPAL